jgi:hypothetical protein
MFEAPGWDELARPIRRPGPGSCQSSKNGANFPTVRLSLRYGIFRQGLTGTIIRDWQRPYPLLVWTRLTAQHVENWLGYNLDSQHSGRSTLKLGPPHYPNAAAILYRQLQHSKLRAQPMLKREDGARFEATIQTTSDGPQAAYVVGLQADDHTLTETDVQLFANKESAEA